MIAIFEKKTSVSYDIKEVIITKNEDQKSLEVKDVILFFEENEPDKDIFDIDILAIDYIDYINSKWLMENLSFSELDLRKLELKLKELFKNENILAITLEYKVESES